MGKKIFISYKYADSQVQSLSPLGLQGILNITTVRDYVTEIQELLSDDHINKGEKDSESLSMFKSSTIASKLKDKIWDSSVTLVVISKGMKEYISENDQWIPWEISYSLKEHTRAGRVSRSNAMLAVVLPDENGSYEYYINEHYCSKCNSTIFQTQSLFSILGNNMFNIKNRLAEYNTCEDSHTLVTFNQLNGVTLKTSLTFT